MSILTQVPGKKLNEMLTELELGMVIYNQEDPEVSVARGPLAYQAEIKIEGMHGTVVHRLPVWDIPRAQEAVWSIQESDDRRAWTYSLLEEAVRLEEQEEERDNLNIPDWEFSDY